MFPGLQAVRCTCTCKCKLSECQGLCGGRGQSHVPAAALRRHRPCLHPPLRAQPGGWACHT